jgi:hypothetical protein
MRFEPVILLLSVVGLAAGPLAMAQTAGTDAPKPAAAAKRGACHDDVLKFCKDVKPGAGRVQQCLTQHEAELSAACRDARTQAMQRVEKFHQACDADVQKLCKDVKPGGGRVAKCLKANEAQLSPACKAEFQASRPAAAQLEQ